jgi:alpha-1,3/alpha-1,6-mannosyltransferase
VRGNTIVPTTILGRFAILCAILRQLHLILHIALFTYELYDLAPDAFFVDQLSAGLPLLKSQSSAPIFFYCHFPDLLLAQGRARLWKRLYRVPFDILEQWSMGFADAIAVNSGFTKKVVAKTWPAVARKRDLKIVSPCIDTSDKKPDPGSDDTSEPLPWKDSGLILSINRFERKKDIALAIRAFASLPKSRRGPAKLVIAGGYDNRVPENVGYHAELVALVEELSLQSATATNLVSALNPAHASAEVLFLLSVPNRLKEMLLASARLLVYTPSNEHFGIVPLEAMLRGVPVLAANNGGPTETVVDGVTGWLRDPEDVKSWSEVMGKALGGMKQSELENMGRKGTERVKSKFADVQMAETLDGIFDEIVAGRRETRRVADAFLLLFSVAVVVGLVSIILGLYQWLKDIPKAEYAT